MEMYMTDAYDECDKNMLTSWMAGMSNSNSTKNQFREVSP